MKKKLNSPYLYAGLTAFAVLTAVLLLIFIMFRRKELAAGFDVIVTILQPFFIGSVLAYLLAPLCNIFERRLGKILPKNDLGKKLTEGGAVFLSALSALAVLAVLILLIVPATVQSILSLVMSVPDYVRDFLGWANNRLADHPEIKKYLLNAVDVVYEKFDSWTQSELMPSIETILSGVGTSINVIVNLVLNVVIGFIISIYLLNSRRTFARQAKMTLYALFRPKAADMLFDEIKFADRMFSGFLRGKVLDSAIVGMICFVVLTIMKFPDVLLISVIVGVTNIIPFFGPFIGAVPSALIIFVMDPKKCIYFIIFIIILQQFDGNILGPKCMGNSINLSAFWVLFAILLFGGLWKVAGMIIGVPLFAVIYDIFKKFIYYKLKKNGKQDMLSSEDPPETSPPDEPTAAEPETPPAET